MLASLIPYLPWLLSAISVALAVWSSAHVILYKRDPRSSISWVGLIWLAPILGSALYFVFGINRIQRKAFRLRRRRPPPRRAKTPHLSIAEAFVPHPPNRLGHLHRLARLMGRITQRSLLHGNRIQVLENGDQAYPAMLEAIQAARQSITLSTYIFEGDAAGKRFVDALGSAVSRGVEVRVLIDDIGAHYSWPAVFRLLHRARVPTAAFLPQLLPAYLPYANLRNHRKTLVVDGRIGFTGGINIREGNELAASPRHPIQDLHFRIDGLVVAHLQEVFADDWHFCTKETLDGDQWFPKLEAQGPIAARGISGGPDDNFERMRMAYLGALTCARRSVRIVTPYFLPDISLVAALTMAAMRGVEVDILIPQKNNLLLVQWATMASLWQVLEHGCRVWMTPPPFDHSKLILVDGAWTLFGSANWDPRSLRLNFEFDVECYSRELTGYLEELVRRKLEKAQPVTLADVDRRSLPIKLRDGIARLFTPYL